MIRISTVVQSVGIFCDEFTNPPVADTDAFKTAIATAITLQTYTGVALNGVVGAGALTYPRNVTVTTDDHVAAYTGSVTFTGLDTAGNAISESLALVNNSTVAGVKAFSSVSSISVPAQNNTTGSLQFGFGAKLGLTRKAKTRNTILSVIKEIVAGSVVTNGVFAVAATGLPYGTYAPNTPPDASTDYVVYYETDPS